MNLSDILLPKRRYYKPIGAERAERAESQQPRVIQSPPTGAGSETLVATGSPPNPPNPPAPTDQIEKPLPVTMEYFGAQGLELLSEDLAFLRWHLPRDTTRRNRYITRYIAAWLEAMASEPLLHRKANRGRFTANSLLRVLAGK